LDDGEVRRAARAKGSPSRSPDIDPTVSRRRGRRRRHDGITPTSMRQAKNRAPVIVTDLLLVAALAATILGGLLTL
jgi:hypothetical protein